MKNLTLIALLIIACSCKRAIVSFSEPQPEKVGIIKRIPKRICGQYFNVEDTINLSINENSIVKMRTYIDSLNHPAVFLDTVFSIARNDVLKRYKGFFFINHEFSSGNWEVEKLKYKHGILSIGEITSEAEINNLEKITETVRDSVVPFKVKPTKQQFKAFLKSNGFSGEEAYVRVK
jgi:hypothetical protein